MITWELILALAVYNFIMYVTPGPNNSILTASGIKFGFARSIPNILGIPTGHGLQLALVCLGLGTLFITYPILYDISIHSLFGIQNVWISQYYKNRRQI